MSVEIVAELSNAANGKFANAIKLLDAAKACGADAAKIQTYLPSEIVALRGDGPAPAPWNDRLMSDLYAQAATPFDWIPKLFAHAREIGLPIFSSVFGHEGLALLESLGCERYKIAALDNRVEWLVAAVDATGKPYLMSDNWAMRGLWGEATMLFCPPQYPTLVDAVHLPRFDTDGWFGLSSHCLAPELPVAAVARGAKLIEMHMQLDAEPSELEANVGLGETAFATMVRSVRQTERLLA